MRPSQFVAGTAACLVMLTSVAARANGRFPRAQEIVFGPGAEPVNVAVRATFGIVVSDDGGGSFHYLCEDAFQYLDGQDPSIALGTDGALLAGTPDGLLAMYDRCTARRLPLFDGTNVIDLATDRSRQIVVAAVNDASGGRIAQSGDGGRTFRFATGVFPDFTIETVDVAPSDPSRWYVTGFDRVSHADQIHRSSDSGRSWLRTTAMLQGTAGLFVAAVDPTRADRVYIRAQLAGVSADDAGTAGSVLLRSDDGGDHVQEVARTDGPMYGFASSDDGRHVWIGGPDPDRDGLQRSDDGAPFAAIQRVGIQCLRYHGGALYACATFVPNGTMVFRSRDNGDSLDRWVGFDDVQEPPACPGSTVVGTICPARWRAVQSVIAPSTTIDAGVRDDHGVTHDACSCGVVGSRGARGWRWLAVAMAVVTVRRRAKRGVELTIS